MKKLILVRHAKTEQPTGSMTDFERKLKPRGHEDSKIIAHQLIEKGVSPELIISSPAKRAKQTSQILSKEFNYNINQIRFEEFVYYGYTTGEFISYIHEINDTHPNVMFVGHNPDIASLAINLTNHNLYTFPTCAVIVITFDVDSWKEIEARSGQTELFIYPSQFKE